MNRVKIYSRWQVNVINLTSPWFYVAPENQKKHQVPFRAKRGILAGADISGTLEDFSRWSK
jgi:hypothetical protein